MEKPTRVYGEHEFGKHTSNQAGKIVCGSCGRSVSRSDVTTDGFQYLCTRCSE